MMSPRLDPARARRGRPPGAGRAEKGWLARPTAGALVVCALLAGCGSAPGRPVQDKSWVTSATASRTPSATTASPPTARPAPARSRRPVSSDVAASSLDRWLERQPAGHAAVAVQDLSDGRMLARGAASHPFVTASIAKVDILATLLLERQDEGASGLTAGQRTLATGMIEASDNHCANLLFRQAGGAWGLGRANRRFGLTATRVHEPQWGLTTTTVGDQLRLLQQVFTARSALNASSRAYLQRLMGQVEADQNWGISAAAQGHYALKNGWLPRPDGTWTVNSIGQAVRHGHLLLIAVLTDDDPSEGAGIAGTENLAKAAATAVTGS